MFSLIESKEEIANAQHKLEISIHRDFKSKAVRNIGYPGGTIFNAEVATDGIFWYRFSNDKNAANPRRLNSFGLMTSDASLQITIEINTPYEGRNDRLAGFFARDNATGMIYLFHSGGVGGGTKGVGKTAFLTWSNYTPKEIADSSGKIKLGVLVMPVEGPAASQSIKAYIRSVANFKQAIRNGEINSPEFRHKEKALNDFFSESRGRRRGHRSTEIDYLSRHGEIVDALHDWRLSGVLPKNGKLTKNIFLDMGVKIGDELTEVFEVKTSTSRPDIYAAIGQLMVHGTSKNCRRVIVLPERENMPSDIQKALKRLNIELLKFKLDEEKVTIIPPSTLQEKIPVLENYMEPSG